jgi:hypothetical protein
MDCLGKLCISQNPSLRAQRSNPFLLANQSLMDRRVAALLAMTAFCRPSLAALAMTDLDFLRSALKGWPASYHQRFSA